MIMHFNRLRIVLFAGVVAGAIAHGPAAAASDTDSESCSAKSEFVGHVYAMNNDPTANAIIHYGRRANGQLVQQSATPTNGRGSSFFAIPGLTMLTADPLASQQAIKLSADHRFLLGVNTVDHTVAAFRVSRDGELTLTDLKDSGGLFPNTIGMHDRLVYVGNVGNPAQHVPGNVTGFRLSEHGELTPIRNSTRLMSHPDVSEPAHALFSPDGRQLVVSDLTATELAVFPVEHDGLLGKPTFNVSAGPNPLGMIFAQRDILLVSESSAGGLSSVSSYRLDGTRLNIISSQIQNGESASCWMSVTPDYRFAFSGNTGETGSVSTYHLSHGGQLNLVFGPGATRPVDPRVGTTAPLDSFVTADGKYLYQHFAGLGLVGAFTIGSDGLLTPIPGGDGGGLPFAGSQGLDGF